MSDFFISYNWLDIEWARWIAWQVEAAGFTATFQEWDFDAGTNFVVGMQDGATSERTIAVLSENYINSKACMAEASAAIARDLDGKSAILLPVRIQDFTPRGLFTALIYIDLVDKSEEEAVKLLLTRLKRGRRKPLVAPGYPQGKPKTQSELIAKPAYPPAVSKTTWNVPHSRNPFFTGRDDDLVKLRKAFTSEANVAISQSLAVTGLGGLGKTQLAVEYAHRYKADYTAVFWVVAATTAGVNGAYADIARLLDLPESKQADQGLAVAAVRRWLENSNGWLLIFDNADDLAIVKPFYRRSGTGISSLRAERHFLTMSPILYGSTS